MLFLLIGLLLGLPAISRAETPDPVYQIKAGLIFNFVNFTRWPEDLLADESTDFQLCILGEDPYSEIFISNRQHKARGRQINARKIEFSSDKENFKACHILFIRLKEKKKLERVIAALTAKPILTISEFEEEPRPDSMINFSINPDNRISFSIHRGKAKESGIDFSSKMLRLAEKVIGGQK